MAKEIITEISIDGKELPHFVHFSLKQDFNAHHSFELVINQDALAAQSHSLQSTQDYIGKFIGVAFGEDAAEDNFFRGIITEVGYKQSQGNWPQLLIKGYSPTFLLEGGKHYASFLDRTLKSVVEDLSANLASNDLNLRIQPKFSGAIPYLTQYNESHFQCINRLAVEYGEWFYFNGQDLFFGKPSAKDKVKLVYGSHLHDFQFSLALAPTKTNHYSYNYSDDTLYKSEAPKSVDGADSFTEKAQQVTDKLYRNGVQQPTATLTTDQGLLDGYSKHQKGAKAAQSVTIKAKGDSTKVKIGGLVEIHLNQTDALGKSNDEQAEFLVTSISHEISGSGSYNHHFTGISSKSEYIPASVDKPTAETQVAVVTDNADPEGIGRVKVQMLWQKLQSETTDWIRVSTLDAGSSGTVDKNRGFVFVPEIGDQVLVSFRYNDPDRPYVTGSLFHGKNGAGGGKGNTLKSIKTRSGHTIAFDDTEGSESITITDKKNNIITLDTASSSITISAPETISIQAKNIDISATENISIGAGDNISAHAGEDYSLNAKNITNQAEMDLIMQAKSIEKNAEKIKIESTKENLQLSSSKQVVNNSGEKVKLF